MLVDGAEVHLRDPADALSRGISMVHQELSVLPDLTVAENLLLGREPVWFSTVVSRRKLHDKPRSCSPLSVSRRGRTR